MSGTTQPTAAQQLPYHLNLGKQNGLRDRDHRGHHPPGVLRRLAQAIMAAKRTFS